MSSVYTSTAKTLSLYIHVIHVTTAPGDPIPSGSEGIRTHVHILAHRHVHTQDNLQNVKTEKDCLGSESMIKS